MKPRITRTFKYDNREIVCNADARTMRELLGLKSSAKLPIQGMPVRLIQGARVYVAPKIEKRRRHRIFVICECETHVPFGRLQQHICK